MPKHKIGVRCSKCKSTNVMRDAWATWDTTAQQWVLGCVYDQGFCDRCEGEENLEEFLLVPKAIYIEGDALWAGATPGWYWYVPQGDDDDLPGDTCGPFETEELAKADMAKEMAS